MAALLHAVGKPLQRGKDLQAVAEALTTIENANAALEEYARGRRQQLSTG